MDNCVWTGKTERKERLSIRMTICCFPSLSWTKEQWLVLLTLAMTHLCNGMCVSLQAPFYPAEAEKKGASATEYGLVFGIFELTVFIVSPFIGLASAGHSVEESQSQD